MCVGVQGRSDALDDRFLDEPVSSLQPRDFVISESHLGPSAANPSDLANVGAGSPLAGTLMGRFLLPWLTPPAKAVQKVSGGH
jgi:hypothetical protein